MTGPTNGRQCGSLLPFSFKAVIYCQESQQLVDNYDGYAKYIHGTMFWSICVHFPWGLTTTVHVNV